METSLTRSVVGSMNQQSVCRQSVTVNLENGLHLVPCSLVAQTANRFGCRIQIHKGDLTVDAKTMLELMTLDAACGTVLVLEASGDGADEAIRELVHLFESDFEVGESTDH